MLISQIKNAMRLAKYEILEDGQYYGEIHGSRAFGRSPITWKCAAKNYKVCLKTGSCLGSDWGINFQLWQGYNLSLRRLSHAAVWCNQT